MRLEPHAQAIRDEVAAAKAQLETLESEMTEHTPGPWHVVIDDTGGPYSGWPEIVAEEKLDTTIIHRAGFHHEFWDWHPGLPESLANARLISAAPDMLKALRRAQRVLSMTQVDGTSEFMKEIEAAISKAQPDDMESDDA
jgi:hypothetical protein